MNIAAVFSLISNVSVFFTVIYFLFKIKPVKAALIYHNRTQTEYIAIGGLTILFSVLNMLTSAFGIQIGTSIVNVRTGIVVIAIALMGHCRVLLSVS